ncbi:hypothetical protein Esti_003179 [Eimeria stiedai]
MKSAARSVAGSSTPKPHQARLDPEGGALPSDKMLAPDAQHRELDTVSVHGVKRDYSILEEVEAGERDAHERNNLNSRLFELGTELRKVRRINDILEAENADLRERVLHQMEMYPGASDIRALARRYGPDLAKSVGLLIEENKALRLKLQSSIRSHARLEGTAADLGNALRDHEERTYARDLASAKTNQEGALDTENKARRTNDTLDRVGADASVKRAEDATGGGVVKRYCTCSEKLQELLNCIDSQIVDYERGVWQAQVNVLEEERDSLMLKTVVMRQRLAEVQAKIISDPFLAARFGSLGEASGPFDVSRGRNTMAEMRDTLVQLATAQDVNAELEKRLASEKNISRSWQANLRALQRELRDHLADLSVAARASGLRCDMLRGTIAQAAEAAAVKELQGFTRSEKESLRLLRLARDRIASDAQRIENYVVRVRELEQEVADLRCDMTQLERGHGQDGGDSDEVSDNDEKWCVALRAGDATPSDVECTIAALRTCRQLLVDRAEAKKALNMLEDRKRELRERQEKFQGDAGVPPPLGEAREELSSKVEHKVTQRIDIFNRSNLATSTTELYDALTTDKAREVFRRLMVLREYARIVPVPVASQRTASETAGGRSDEADGKLNVTELKKLQNDIDRREISLQQAEEAIQARAALRTIEAEHAKTLQKKEAEFEERTRLQAKQAHEQLVKQQKAYEAQLAKERDRCESLRVELELQAKELDLQRHLAEENIMATSQKQQQELEDELRRLREQQRQTEMQLQRTVAEAAREASAMQSAAIQEKFSLSAAVQAAERKASEALKMVEKKEREMETLQEKLKQTQAERPAPPPSATPSPQAVEKKHRGPSYALKKFQTAARQVAVGQAFARLAKNKRMKTITPASSAGKCQGLQVSAGDSAATPPTLSPRSYFRQMVPEKYTSLASAFRHMDVDHSGTVKLSEFANFVDDLGMNISFSVTHDLYKELAAPCDGMLVLSNFYKNLKGDSCTLTELHRRLEEIFGDVEQPFDDAGIPSDGRVTKEQFILIADEAGVSSTSATDLWNSMDRAHRGSLQRENVLLLLEDNVELDEVERVEQEAAAVLSNVLNVFSGSLKAPKPEAKVSRRSSFKKLTYTAAHRQLGFTPAEAQADDVLANSPPWDCIYPEDRKAMVSDMKARTVGKGRLIQAEEDPNCPLFIITQGTVDIFQPGFIQYSLIQQLTAPCLLYSENVLGGTPSEACAKAGSDEDVSLYELDRSIFERSYKRLLVQREREVADYQALLRKVPVVNKLSPLSLRCIASSFRKRTFHPDEEIIAKGDDADHVLMVKDGEAVAVGLKSSHEEVEVRVYRPLDFFGDGNIVKGRVHTASVRARTKCTILSIESEVFYNILQKLETEFRRRSGRSSTVEAGYLQKQNIGTGGPSEEELGPRDSSVTTEERSEDEKLSVTSEMSQPGEIDMPVAATPRKETLVDSELIERLLQEEATRMREECGLLLEAIPVLKDLPKERRQELCNRVTLEIYSPHQAIVLQGEAADKFYIVESGTVSIEIYIGCGKMQKIAEMSSGSFFGEMSLIHHEPRTAYIIALTPVYVYALKASDFEELLGDSYEAFSEHANRMYSQKTTQQATAADTSSRITEAETPEVLHLLSGVPVIKLLTLDQLKELVRAFQVINVGEREVVMHEGDTADKFYILLEGMVSVQKSPEPGKPRKEVAVVNSGEYLGEIAFLNNQPRTASCVAKTKVKLLYLGRDEFNKYLGHLSEAFLQHAESMYSTHQADMPSWLLDASSRSGSGPSSPAGDEALDAKPTSVNEGGKSTHKEKKTKKKPSEEALLSDATAGELEGVDSKKKKKKSKEKDKDKTASKAHTAATAPIAREDLDRLRDLLAGTFKNKYGSLAHAFAAMDVNNSDIVDADEFYAFIKKSNVRGFQKPELDAIFDELCRPIKGRLIVGNLYRNARGVEPTGAEIHLRAIEIYGSALAAFKKVANIDAGDLCLRDNFTSLAAAVGVDKDKAESIWSQYIEGSGIRVGSKPDHIAGSANTSSGAISHEEDAAQVRHRESSKQGDARPDGASIVRVQSATTLGLDGLSVVSGNATEEAGESGESVFLGSAAGTGATRCGSFRGMQMLHEAGIRDSMELETFGESAAGKQTRSCNETDLDSPWVALDAFQPSCLNTCALPPGRIVEATDLINHCSESCEVPDATTLGVTPEQAGESSEPSENVLSETTPTSTETSWFSSLMPAHVLGPEETGLATIVSTVESWVTSAFEEQEGQDKKEKAVSLGVGNEELAPTASGSSSTVDSPRTNGPPHLVPTEAEPDRIGGSAHVGAEPVVQAQTSTCSSASSGISSSPRILLHLCGEPEPILWSASECASQRAWTCETFDESGHSQEDDSRYLHVPLPRLLLEAEGAVEPAFPQGSLEQIAEGLERWILDGPGASAEAQDKADGSVCSSDSSDEDTGERVFDLARVTAFFLGKGEADQAAGEVGDNLDALHKTVNALQPLHPDTSTSRNSASSLALSSHKRGLTTTGSHLLFNELPFHTDKTGRKGSVAPTVLAAQGAYISDKENSPLSLPNLQTHRAPLAEGDGEGDDAAQSAAGSGKIAEECDTSWETSDYDHLGEACESTKSAAESEGSEVSNEKERSTYKGDAATSFPVLRDDISSELTMEEAEAKEASIRSIGNRIWAFFGGRTGAEDALSGSERPTSSDAVEETIQFEDPAVVQRDDHRAFPNETQLLLESIKHNSQLQVLSPQQQRYVASLMRREVVAATTSVAEGAEPALMWCSSGEFEVTQAGFFGVSVVRTMKAGDFFGVEELIAGEKLKFALTPCPSASECVLWILDKELFLDSVKDMLGKREAFVPVAQAFLHMVPLVRDLPEEQIAAVAKACKAERFAEGQTVFKMGFHGDMLCFIYSGEAITQKPQDDGGLLELARQGRGEYFGEMALIRNTRRTASVVAGTELLLLCLDKDSFETLLAPLKEKMAAKAASSYKRQDDAPPTESEPSGADGSSAPSLPSSRAAGEACVKKRTRKSSLALLNYSKIRDQEKQAEDGQGDCNEEKPPARWRLAQEPEVIHEPPPSTAVGGRSCLKGKDTQSRGRTRKSPVRFDEGSLLPSEPSSEED